MQTRPLIPFTMALVALFCATNLHSPFKTVLFRTSPVLPPPLFYSPSRNPQHADIGQQMEAYFDKEKKKWIFPGEAPEDNAPAAPSAPPTAAQLSSPLGPPTGSSSPASTSPGLDANDPLAALMAPPKVPLGGPRRHATTGRMGVGGPPISGGSPPLPGGPPSGGMNWARPAGGSIGSPFAAVPGPGGGGRGGKVTAFAPKSSGGGSATSASRGSSVSSGAEGASSGGN